VLNWQHIGPPQNPAFQRPLEEEDILDAASRKKREGWLGGNYEFENGRTVWEVSCVPHVENTIHTENGRC
jgi:hypothetical protein